MMLDLIKNDKNKEISVLKNLKENYGLGKSLANKICKEAGICRNQMSNSLETEQIEKITKISSKFKLGLELKESLKNDLIRLVDIKTYRGIRRVKGYPVRGQRTHSNAKNSRKNKRVKTL